MNPHGVACVLLPAAPTQFIMTEILLLAVYSCHAGHLQYVSQRLKITVIDTYKQ